MYDATLSAIWHAMRMRLIFSTLGETFAQQCRLRGNLDLSRGSASPVLYRLRYILPPLLNEFLAPVFELFNDTFNAAGLFNCPHFNPTGVVIAQARIRQLHDGMGGVSVEALAEFI